MSTLTIDIPQISTTISSIKIQSRCGSCRKKVNLIQFPCKCGGIYCTDHRIGATHSCTYDYQSENKKLLSTNLVKLDGLKVDQI
jgi:hypothetical protein